MKILRTRYTFIDVLRGISSSSFLNLKQMPSKIRCYFFVVTAKLVGGRCRLKYLDLNASPLPSKILEVTIYSWGCNLKQWNIAEISEYIHLFAFIGDATCWWSYYWADRYIARWSLYTVASRLSNHYACEPAWIPLLRKRSLFHSWFVYKSLFAFACIIYMQNIFIWGSCVLWWKRSPTFFSGSNRLWWSAFPPLPSPLFPSSQSSLWSRRCECMWNEIYWVISRFSPKFTDPFLQAIFYDLIMSY